MNKVKVLSTDKDDRVFVHAHTNTGGYDNSSQGSSTGVVKLLDDSKGPGFKGGSYNSDIGDCVSPASKSRHDYNSIYAS